MINPPQKIRKNTKHKEEIWYPKRKYSQKNIRKTKTKTTGI